MCYIGRIFADFGGLIYWYDLYWVGRIKRLFSVVAITLKEIIIELQSMKDLTHQKQTALKAVDFAKSKMILDLGTGSTAWFALEEIGKQIQGG